MTAVIYEVTWLHYLLKDLQIFISKPVALYCDNQATVHITMNPVFHEQTKHIELHYHLIRK